MTEKHLAFARRIQAMVETIGSQVAAAAVAGVTERQVRKYVKGEAHPPFEVVARLAEASGFDLNWAATGRGSPKGTTVAIRASLMGRVVDAIAGAYREAGAPLPPAELGRLAAEEYQDVAHAASTEDEEIAMARLIAARHRRLLATETPAVRKRRA